MKKFELSIPKPCHEDWNAMKPEEKGRFCGSCQKTVIDFSQMSDRQIAEFFKKPIGSVCGHFSQSQLNREIDVPKKRIPWVRYFFTISIPAFLFSLKASAQGEVRLRGRVAVKQQPISKEVCNEKSEETKAVKTIRGKLVDENGNPLEYVSVMLEKTNAGTTTDKNGHFELRHEAADDAVIVFSYVGYQIKKMKLSDLTGNEAQVLMLQPRVMGEVIVIGAVAYKKTAPIPLIQPLKMDSAFSHFAVYPNPVQSNTKISIEPKKIEAGNYLLQIVTSTGEVVQTLEVVVDKKTSRLTPQLVHLAAGPYFIRLVNKKSDNAYTEIIIVQ